MFQMLTSTHSNEDPFSIETIKPPFEISREGKHQQIACVSCREKKLKCTGEKPGCKRCKNKGISCVYNTPNHSHGPRSQNPSSGNESMKKRTRTDQSSQTISSQDKKRQSEDLRLSSDRSGFSNQPSSVFHTSGGTPGSDSMRLAMGLEAQKGDCLHVEFSLLGQDAFDVDEIQASNVLHFDRDGAETSVPNPIDTSFLDDEPWLNEELPNSSITMTNATNSIWTNRCPIPLGNPLTNKRVVSDERSRLALGLNRQSVNTRGLQTQTSTTPTREAIQLASPPALERQVCQCTRIALEIFEKINLGISTQNDGWATLHQGARRNSNDVFQFKKRELSHCISILECERCINQSPIMMLLLYICERMIASFRQLCQVFPSHCGFQPTPASPESRPSSSHASLFKMENGTGGVGLGYSNLDFEDEIQVMKVLMQSQMKRLEEILVKLEHVVDTKDWQGHSNTLKSIKSTFRTTAAVINKLGS